MRSIPWKKSILALFSVGITTVLFLLCVLLYMYLSLPNVNTLKTIQLQVPLRIYTAEGQLMAEFGEKRRIPITVDQVPQQLIQAILATEDQRYYNHPGVDMIGLVRATASLITTGRKSQGASTITMQVARNFFLTRKKTYSRKINEILLAVKIEAHFSKEKILELYLNKIYLGQRAYGVAAAAQVYYGKTLSQLTLPQMAMIAGLPQAPSRDNPVANPKAALTRRNHVLARMLENHVIDNATYENAIRAPVTARYHHTHIAIEAPYIAEMARAAMVDVYGKDAYTMGLKVFTTIHGDLQAAANNALHSGLLTYDKRHGYRGPITHWDVETTDALSQWKNDLRKIKTIHQLRPAVIIDVEEQSATALLASGDQITIPWSGLSWARQRIYGVTLGPYPKSANEVLKDGDVVYVEPTDDNSWTLSQIPLIEGALIALDPRNGAIRALNGGFSFINSNFNRVTQAKRQPGSAFKPFIYSAALAKKFTLATLINDAPIVTSDTGENELWRPHNVKEKFYGPTRLREGLTKSRNLVSIRILQAIGIEFTLQYLHRFGFNTDALPHALSLALGSGAVTPLQLTTGYAVFANNGFKVKPYFIDHVERPNGELIYQEHPLQVCESCLNHDESTTSENDETYEENYFPAPRVITPQNAYLITNVLQDVIKHGTGRKALSLHRDDLAGKTGTTNDQFDAWFAGFNSDLVSTVWVGYDEPRSLFEYGAQVALPIWIDFMKDALANTSSSKPTPPPDIVNVRIDPKTGLLASPDQTNSIFEVFRQENAPTEHAVTGANYDDDLLNTDDGDLF